MTKSLSRCMRCGSDDLEDRLVEKLVKGGTNAVALNVKATVCHHCGERYFDLDTVELLEDFRHKLERDDLDGLHSIGKIFRPSERLVSNGLG